MADLTEARAFYAKLVAARGGVDDARVIAAFAAAPRERFVGAGPWKLFTPGGYLETPNNDPLYLYQDVLVALAEERGINNGEPSLHAKLMAAAVVQPGERVLHVGAGTGYYSAILAELVGADGRVEAYEIENDLAALAAAHCTPWPRVRVHARSASEPPLPASDVIYVNAGATQPMPAWLDALNDKGRLIFPLTSAQGQGVMLLVTRVGEAFNARILSGAAFIPCVGAIDEKASTGLFKALASGGAGNVRSLRRGGEPDASAWLVGDGWWLSTQA